MKIEIGKKVIGKSGQGVITKIITKSTGYVEVDYNGFSKKEMAFNLTDENGIALKSAPKKSAPKVSTIDDKIQNAKNILLSVNDRWNSNSTYKLACDIFGKVQSNGNDFIESLLNSFFTKNFLSEKQAYFLAKFTIETNQF